MSYDPVDIWGGAFGSLLKQSFLYASAVWIGCSIGGGAIMVEKLSAGVVPKFEMLNLVWASPVLLVSLWGIPNLLVLLIGVIYFIRSESASYVAWIVLAAIESLVVMLGWAGKISTEWIPRTAAWGSWLILLTMAATGVFFLRQFHINRWALQMARIEAENARRRAEMEARQSPAKSE